MRKPVGTTIFARPSWLPVAQHALIALLVIGAYLGAVAFRHLDDNALVSWRWVFGTVHPGALIPPLVVGIIIAYALSRAAPPERFFAPLLFLVSFVAATLFWREPEVVVDASRYFTQARHLEAYGVGYFLREWGRDIVAWTDMPLVPFLYGAIFALLGESRAYIQLFTTALFSATVVCTYLIGRTLWSESVGLCGGLLLLGIPYLFTQVPLMLVDVPTMFFTTLAIFSFLKALARGGVWATAVSPITLALALLSKYSALAVLPVLAVIFLVYLRDAGTRESALFRASAFRDTTLRRRVVFRAGITVAVAALLAGAVVVLKFDIFAEQIGLLLHYQRPGLRRWQESFYSTFLFQVHPFLTLAALYSLYAAARRRDARYAIVGSFVLLMVVLQVERARYLIMVFPALALMASCGLQQIRDARVQRFIVLCTVASSLVVALFAYLPFVGQISAINLKHAGEYLNAAGSGRVEVLVLPAEDGADVNPATAVPLLDLFTDRDITYRYERLSPDWERVATSSLRFTWAYENPPYYAPAGDGAEDAVVVVSGSTDEALPADAAARVSGYRLAKTFATSTGVFRYRTVVWIYEREGGRAHRSPGFPSPGSSASPYSLLMGY